jgi:hypothetical protein
MSEYRFNFDLKEYTFTLAKQTFAALPLSYYLTDSNKIFSDGYDVIVKNNLFVILFIIIVTYLFSLLELLKLYVKEVTDQILQIKNSLFLFLFGLLLLILPGIFISATQKYQNEIYVGYGYLPVYISYFGVSLIIISIIYTIFIKFNTKKNTIIIISIIVAILCSTIGGLNYINNTTVVENSNLYWQYPRSLILEGIHNNLFTDLPENSRLIVESNYPWDQTSFYSMSSGKKFSYVASGKDLMYVSGGKYDLSMFSNNGSNNLYYLRYDSSSNNNGYAILASIESIDATNDSINNVSSNYVYLYTRTPNEVHDIDGYQVIRHVKLDGKWIDNTNISTNFSLDQNQMEMISSGNNWKLFRIYYENKRIDVKSLSVAITPYSIGF